MWSTWTSPEKRPISESPGPNSAAISGGRCWVGGRQAGGIEPWAVSEKRGDLVCVVTLHSLPILVSLVALALSAYACQAAEDASAAAGKELLADTAFASGFGVGGWAVVEMSPHKARPIPDDGKPKAWEFGEGAHRNFTDASGKHVDALYEHLLVVNHVLEADRPDCLSFAQYNNYGLSRDDPRFGTRLVKRVESDRHGTIRLYYNTKNEIWNAATAYAPQYADDLWPHLLLWQTLREEPRLADWGRIDLSFDVTLVSQAALSDWLPSREMCLMLYVMLRDEQTEEHDSLWVGLMVQSSNMEKNYCEHIGREQHGDVFYRDTITNYGPPPLVGRPREVSLDVKALTRKAIARFDDVHATLSRDPDAYSMQVFNFGWEALGHWESEITVSGLSLYGRSPSSNGNARPVNH